MLTTSYFYYEYFRMWATLYHYHDYLTYQHGRVDTMSLFSYKISWDYDVDKWLHSQVL